MGTGLDKIRAASARPLLKSFFKEFGYHCATHQIRVILISCVVITSLLYPALALYASSGPLSTLSSSLLNLFPTDSQSPHLRDLRDLWNGHEALHLRYDATAKARCGLERTVRVERLLVANNRRHENGVLNKATLGLTLNLERLIATSLASSTSHLPCVQAQNGSCLFTSPLSFWDHDEHVLAADDDIIRTLNNANNTFFLGFPVTLDMVVADRASLEREEGIDSATFLVLTYFFRDNNCHSQSGHLAWVQLVNDVMQGKGHADPIVAQPRLLAIQFDADQTRLSAISVLLYATYLLVFIHFSGSMRRMNTVHSRFGIAFTGIVEIIVSTITSVSVCAIWGFRVTMVPWGILPIVIVFVGAENMFRLVDDVVSTSITLPVKERIARGLSEAGASNTLKVVTCNAALGIIAVVAPGAIRQFCVFAIVVLVAHWFLVHTFFVAVLSIDLQRLELHDLLRQDKSKDNKSRSPSSPSDSRLSLPGEAGGLRQFLHGRAARNGSLIMMLAITAVLYSITSSAVPGNTSAPFTLDKIVALRKAGSQSPAWKLWQTLNPMDDPLVHMRTEPPTLVFFEHPSASEEAKTYRDRKFTNKMARGGKHMVKIFVLPIATTTALLWVLLVYLLKDTEDRDSEDNSNVQLEIPAVWQKGFRFSTLPRACGADIERLDATPDGSTIIAVSLENEVTIWSRNSRSFFELTISDIGDQVFVTAVAMDSVGNFCAVGSRSGVVKLWRLDAGKIAEQRLLGLPSKSSRVVDLVFEDRPAQRGNRPSMLHRRSLSGDTHTTDGYLLATYKDGTVVEWNDLFDPKPLVIVTGSSNNTKAIILRPGPNEALGFGLISNNGGVQMYSRNVQSWQGHTLFHPGSVSDPVAKVHAQTINIDLASFLVVVTASQSGQISIWDGVTGQRWYAFDETVADVNRLRLTPVPLRSCTACEELFPDMFILTISTGTIATIHRFAVDDPRRCSCPMLQPSNNALRSRQSSFTSSSAPFSRPRASGLSTSGTNISTPAEFPVSAHGVHSRRGSERDPPPARRQDGGFYLFEDGGGVHSDAQAPSLPTFHHSRIAEVSFEEGAWDILDHVIYGLKRSSELETLQEDASEDASSSVDQWGSHFEGLEKPVLERWRLWVFDPTSPNLGIRESSLAALASRPNDETPPPQPAPGGLHNRTVRPPTSNPFVSHPHSSRTYLEPSAFPRLPFTEVSSLVSLGHSTCLAAFGNTVGLVTFSPDPSSCVTRHSRTSSTTTNPLVGKKRI